MLSLDEIKKIAKLSNLVLSDNDLLKYQKQLSDIIGLFSKLAELDTKEVPFSHFPVINTFRATDQQSDSLTQNEVISNASASVNNMVKVSNIFGKAT